MIQIDMDMPKRCIECPLCKHLHLANSPLLIYACGKGTRPIYSHETADGVDEFCKMLKPDWCPLKEVEPERKTGHWIYDENGMDWNLPAWVCSECHGRNDMIPTYIQGKDKMIKVEHPLRWAGSKYCPNCGAKMVEDK